MISWCRIQFKFFIFIIIIIYLIYNIGFISYMEENIDCFEECSLKDIDESILLKDIKELKNLKIEELNPKDLNIEEEKRENIILYLVNIYEKIQFILISYGMLHIICYIFRDIFILLIPREIKHEVYVYFNESLFFNEFYLSIEFFILSRLECYYMLGCCVLYDVLKYFLY